MKWEFILIALLLFSCEKLPEQYDNLNDGRVMVIGHGGGGEQNLQNPHPWNSWASIESGLASDADGIEVDIQLSADSVLMLFHDTSLAPSTDCEGCISTNTSVDLMSCTQTAGIFASGHDHPIISAEQLLVQLNVLKAMPRILLDLKTIDPCGEQSDREGFLTTYAGELVSFCEEYPSVVILSTDVDMLEILSQSGINADLYLDGSFDDDVLFIDLAKALSLDGLAVEYDDITKEEVAMAHAEGLKVVLFGTFDVFAHRVALQKSPDGMITDNIVLLRELLD